MVVFHLSDRDNRESILSKGILPSTIRYTNHIDAFQAARVIPVGIESVSYFCVDSYLNEKYIKDLIYCKNFLHPRSDFFNSFFEKFDDFYNFDNYNIPLSLKSRNLYDIYEVDLPELEHKKFYHTQYSEDDKYASTYGMREEFEHYYKPIYVTGDVVKGASIVGSVLYDYDISNHSTSFSFNK